MSLELIPSGEELKEAVWSCDLNKSPGYNGFNIKFVKEMWPIIGEEVIDFVRCFFQRGHFPKVINTTWITLIPKNSSLTSIDEFKPISMVGCLYNIISKIIAMRLKSILPELFLNPKLALYIRGNYYMGS